MRLKLRWIVLGWSVIGVLEAFAESGGTQAKPRVFEVLKVVPVPDGSLTVDYRATLPVDAGSSVVNYLNGSAVVVRQNGRWRVLRVTRTEQTLEFREPEIVEAGFP